MTFKAFTKIGPDRYRERYGLDFEDFEVGQVFQHRPGITISQQDNKDEAIETINNAQLHYDANYADKTEWKHCLGVSTLTIQKVMGSTWKTFARSDRIRNFKSISMTKPVFGGDTLYSTSKVLGIANCDENNDLGFVTVETSGQNQHGEIVVTIEYEVLIPKAGKHPMDGASSDVLNFDGEHFLAVKEIDKNIYRECSGLFFEDFKIGEVFEHRPGKTFTLEENRIHNLHSLNWNYPNVDLTYSDSYLGGKTPVNQTYLVGTVTAMTTRVFGRVVANLQWKNIRFSDEVCVGDTIYPVSEIRFKRVSKSRPSQGIIETETRAYNQNGDIVLSYERTLLVYKSGLGPYEASGY